MFPATGLMVAGLWLMIEEKHSHLHLHEEMTHAHLHGHEDIHHRHDNSGTFQEPHVHEHTHHKEAHAHAHCLTHITGMCMILDRASRLGS